MTRFRRPVAALAALVAAALPVGCTGAPAGRPVAASSPSGTATPTTSATTTATSTATSTAPSVDPNVTSAQDARPATSRRPGVYAAARAGRLAPAARAARSLVYVPDSLSNRVDVIDPRTYRVIRRFAVGREPQHVVPSWDLRTLWVNDDLGNDLVPIDPRTGRPGRRVPVADPYNLYFTPDGRHALVMAERLRRIDVRDPHTMRLQWSVHVPCRGVNHADFTADGSWLLASCEFSGKLLVLPGSVRRVARVLDLNAHRTGAAESARTMVRMSGPVRGKDPGATSMPQDVRLTDDGRTFVVADMLRGGVWLVDAARGQVRGFLPTGAGAHGIYPSRDGAHLYVTNRDEGTISVLDRSGHRVVARWRLPKGASPDMGGVDASGRRLWLSGRYDGVVYVLSTSDGRLLRTVRVGSGPHGLAVWPQPGRFSLGHTGNLR